MRNWISEFIEAGLLTAGESAFYGAPKLTATIETAGIYVDGKYYQDPTLAMQAALGRALPDDNGWIFWSVEDVVRGYFKPLEHVRAAHQASTCSTTIKTSETHPLRIDTLQPPTLPGPIGMTFCPGKKGIALYGGAWSRDIHMDITCIKTWGAGALVTILEEHEFELLGVPELGAVASEHALEWIYLSIRDSDTPSSPFEEAWPAARERIKSHLSSGQGVVFHCRGGLGRTGLVVARLLIEEGISPDDAIHQVRQARPGTIETWEQEQYVRALATR